MILAPPGDGALVSCSHSGRPCSRSWLSG